VSHIIVLETCSVKRCFDVPRSWRKFYQWLLGDTDSFSFWEIRRYYFQLWYTNIIEINVAGVFFLNNQSKGNEWLITIK